MSGATDFQGLQDRLSQSDRVLWLGRLVWYGVSDVKIGHVDLVHALVGAGLGAYLPPLPSDADVFRRVCTAAQRKRVATSDPGVYENYLVRDLGADREKIVKRLVRESVSKGDLLYETHMCTFTFYKAAAELIISCTASSGVVANDIAEQVRRDYESSRGTINSYGVRELIRRILTGLNAVNVRGSGGGVYFVSEDHGDMLNRLEAFAATMPSTVLFHTLPLLDDSKQREMLRHAFESETVDEIERVINEIAELEKAGKKLTADKVAVYVDMLDSLRAKSVEYTDLLETNLSSTASSLGIFQRMVMNLMTKVEV